MLWKGFCKGFRQIIDNRVRPSTLLLRLSPQPLLQVLESLGEEARLRRVADLAARQEAAQHDARGLELVHVLEDEDFHLARPQRDLGRARIAIDGRGVATRKR